MTQILRMWLLVPVCLAAVTMTGCNDGGRPVPASTGNPEAIAVNGAKYLLAAEPAGAKPVKDVRATAKDGDDVVVVGHIGGDAKPWVEGRAAFWIIDPSIKPCPPEEGCPTPWDCCCLPKDELVKVMATVKVVDAGGQTVAVDARKLLGVKESQTVVAQGKAKRDDKGNLTVLAYHVFVRP